MCIRDRDIGKQIDFGVSYDAATESVRIDTDAPYTESTTPAGGSAITKWNKTMSEFNQAMIDCNWRPEKYLETAKKYAPVITGKAAGTVEDVIAALDAMKGAPVDAVSFEDDRTVNHFWADELRKALGQEVTSGGDSTDGNADNSSSSTTVTDEMLREWELEMIDAINEERRKVGVPELEIDQNLMSWAQYWAMHLTTEFRHSDIDEAVSYTHLDVYKRQSRWNGPDINFFTAGRKTTACFPKWFMIPGSVRWPMGLIRRSNPLKGSRRRSWRPAAGKTRC